MGVKERKARDFKQREEEILAAAYDLLTGLEPVQMTMEMIAEKAEIGRGTIYKHFKTKDEIYAHLILQRREKYNGILKMIAEESENLLQKLIRSYTAYCRDDHMAFIVHKKCVNHCIESNLDEKLVYSMHLQQEEKVTLVEQIMKKAFEELSLNPPNTRYLVYAGWGMMRGAMEFMMEYSIKDELLDEELFNRAIEQILLSGIPGVSL